MFGFGGYLGLPTNQKIQGTTILRNQPYSTHVHAHRGGGMSMITSSQALSGLTPLRNGRFRRLLARRRRDAARPQVQWNWALALPFLMGLARSAGAEVVSLAITHVKLNQLAITVADNASRAEQAQVNCAPRFREADANEVFQAARLQAEDLDIPNRGRVILSSLRRNTDEGRAIAVAALLGKTTWPSRYGTQGTGASGTAFQGMGYTTTKMTADASAAIMFVEVAYDYKPFFLGSILSPKVIRKEAALYVRDDRDLTQIYNPAPAAPVASC